MSSNLQGNPLPSPQANMFQKSMAALASTFEPIQEDDQVMNYAAAQPRMDYILENYNNNLKRVQIPVWKDNLNYNDNMLMLENLIQVPTPATTPLGNRILNDLSEALFDKNVGEQGINAGGQNLNGGQGEVQMIQNQQQAENHILTGNLAHSQEQHQIIIPSPEEMMMMPNDQGLDNYMMLQQSEQSDKVLQQFPRQVLNLQRTDSVSTAYTRRLSGASSRRMSSADIFSEVGSHTYSPPPSIPGGHYPSLEYHQHPGFFYSPMNVPFQSPAPFKDFEASSTSTLKSNPSSLENVRRKSLLQQQQVFGDNSFQQSQQFFNQTAYPSNVYGSPQNSYGESPKRSSLTLSNSGLECLVSQQMTTMPSGYGNEILDPNPPTPASGSDTKKPKKKHTFHCHFQNCKKSFETESRLEKHYASHLPGGEKVKPFKCDQCPVAFSRSHDLKRHMYIHSSSKPFTCPRCFRGFSRRDALVRHETSLAIGKKVNCVPPEARVINEQNIN